MPLVRSLDETKHQFKEAFVVDTGLTESTVGLAPTPWTDAVAASC